MATKLSKTVTRELELVHQSRPVLMRLIPGDATLGVEEAVEFRLKGRRDKFRVSTQSVFRFAMRAAMAGER